MLKLHFVKAALFSLMMALPVIAQTPNEMRQRYEVVSITESYKVRPNIIATVKYNPAGIVEEMHLEVSPPITDCASANPSSSITEEIIDELVPLSIRGKLGLSFQLATSLNNMRNFTAYENVSIERRLDACWQKSPNFTYRSVTIEWKRR